MFAKSIIPTMMLLCQILAQLFIQLTHVYASKLSTDLQRAGYGDSITNEVLPRDELFGQKNIPWLKSGSRSNSQSKCQVENQCGLYGNGVRLLSWSSQLATLCCVVCLILSIGLQFYRRFGGSMKVILDQESLIKSKRSNTLDSERANASERSKIANFYSNRSVLITGGTGFVGKVLIQKLLRSCPDIKSIFIVARPKRDRSLQDRIREIIDGPLFEGLRKTNCVEKLVVIEGDVARENFGLDEHSLSRVMDEVSVVFHSAATVKFDEPIKRAVITNVAGTKNLIEICRKIRKLASLVHVSTAYANCDKVQIAEHIHPINTNPEKLIDLATWMDQNTMQLLKQKLLSARPNTYTYTKALAECLLARCASDLPVVICRPSIVTASWKEPISGWIDNLNGPSGIAIGIGKGMLRSMYGEADAVADIIPVDRLVNLLVTLGWFADVYHCKRGKQISKTESRRKSLDEIVAGDEQLTPIAAKEEGYSSLCPTPVEESLVTLFAVDADSDSKLNTESNAQESEEFVLKLDQFRRTNGLKLKSEGSVDDRAQIPVFHCTSGSQSPITWSRFASLIVSNWKAYPSLHVLRYPALSFTGSHHLDQLKRFMLDFIPKSLLDSVSKLSAKQFKIVRALDGLDKASRMLNYFTSREWDFISANQIFLLDELMSHQDKLLFDHDLRNIGWNDYMEHYVLGLRRFVMREPISNLTRARKNLRFVYYRNLCIEMAFFGLIAYAIMRLSLLS